MEKTEPLITNDAVVLAILFATLAFVFITSGGNNRYFKRFYGVVPPILLCYFIPAAFNTFGIISGERSALYPIASRYLLPASLILLTLGVDLGSLKKLGAKSLIMFFSASFGVMVGGPIVVFLFGKIFPAILIIGGEETWKGLATIAGSWIGGGANQAAMLELFGASKTLFAQMVAVDVLISYIWMAILLYCCKYNERINRWLKADVTAINELEKRVTDVTVNIERRTIGTRELIIVLGVAFGFTGLSHFLADMVAGFFSNHLPASNKYSLTSSFFWLISFATLFGLLLSFTKAKKIEAIGSSEVGSLFLYVLVTCIGMNMNLTALFDNPVLCLIGLCWILVHVIVIVVVAKLIKAPYFFIAVGSQANIGGPVSAPVVAAAFNKHLAPVGVILAVLGYVVGTYAAYVCGLMMQYVTHLLK